MTLIINSSLANDVRAGRKIKTPVIDSHGHIGPGGPFSMPFTDADSIITTLDSIGINKLFFSETAAAVDSKIKEGNDVAIDAMLKYPDRFYAYAVIYPYGPEKAKDELKRCEERGVRQIKIHDTHLKSYLDPAYQKAFEYANEKGFPCLAHTWGQELDEIRELAKRYPQISWICGHSPGPRDEYVAIANDLPNVYIEICCSMAPYGLVEYYIKNAGADKVLYGSDCAFNNAAYSLGRIAFLNIPEEDKHKVLYKNAEKIFKLAFQ